MDDDRLQEIESQLAIIAQQIEVLEASAASQETQINATEQAIAAMHEAQRNREKIRDLSGVISAVNRKLNAIACVGTGAGLIWMANGLTQDAIAVNDKTGDTMFIVGLVVIGYGLAVMTGQEAFILNLISTLNPWRRSD